MTDITEHDITQWVEEAPTDDNREFREAIHTILSAIANEPKLKANMVLKGGILLAVRYQSHRFTKDIDLSTSKTLEDITPDEIQDSLDNSLATTIEMLDYDLDCKVQSCKVNPPEKEKPTFPSINMKIGYAYKNTAKHRRLMANQSPTTISIDYSLNELTPNVEKFNFNDNEEILVYSLTDLVAEKLRSILQQVERNRNRRQDIFDLRLILSSNLSMDGTEKQKILASLIDKAKSRGITVTPESLDNEEIRARSQAEYGTLADEIDGDLPDFDESFDMVNQFYKSLPW
jgi:predicted nucleotidyltransferase component of viral defense system